jgi:TolB-like protein
MGQLFQELKRRNVIRVAIAYAVSAWLLIQVADALFPMLRLPEWTATLVAVLLLIGFPIALIFAWAFELTPEGLKLEKHVVRDESITHATGRKLDFVIIALLVLGLGYFAYDKFVLDPSRDAELVQATTEAVTDQLSTEPQVSAEFGKSIAVLPFRDMSEGQDQRWFADGLAEEILNTLARAPDLMVSSRTSSFRYRKSALDVPEIAKELGVAHILEGSVRRVGGRVRVTAQLIRAIDGFHVWSSNFDRSTDDVISIQEDLAINIAKALKTTMDPVALENMLRAGTRSVEAYEDYLNGLASLTRHVEESGDNRQIKDALDYFEKARNVDPGFAAPHYNSALIWKTRATPADFLGGVFTSELIDVTLQQALDNYRSRMNAAIENAPDEARRMLYQAEVANTEIRGAEAVWLLRRVLEIRPNSFEAAVALSEAARYSNDKEAQLQAMETFLRRGDLVSITEYVNDVRNFVPSEHYVASVLGQVKRFPDSKSVMLMAHRALLWAGEFEEAHKIYARLSREAESGNPITEARQACSIGDREMAEQILQTAQKEARNEVTLWHIFLLLGERDKAAQVLQPLDAIDAPIVLGNYLLYQQFDPRPFPHLMSILEREGLDWPPPRDIPFACPPREAN